MRNPDFVYSKTKKQMSCAVTAQLISVFRYVCVCVGGGGGVIIIQMYTTSLL